MPRFKFGFGFRDRGGAAGAADPHPSDDLLIEGGTDKLLLEGGTDTLLLEGTY